MARRTRRNRGSREAIAGDLEVLPLMNLFIVLIPLLLLSAVFIEVSVIDMAMPSDAEAQAQHEPSLGLAIHIFDGAYVVRGNGVAEHTIARPESGEDVLAEEQLTTVLGEIAVAFPDNREVQIVSQPTTRYDDIIRVMDVAREAGLPLAALSGAKAEAL